MVKMERGELMVWKAHPRGELQASRANRHTSDHHSTIVGCLLVYSGMLPPLPHPFSHTSRKPSIGSSPTFAEDEHPFSTHSNRRLARPCERPLDASAAF